MGAFAIAVEVFEMETERAVTVSFLTPSVPRLFHVFNMRDPKTGVFRNEVTQNPVVWGAVALCGALLLAVYFPPLAELLSLVDPGTEGWLLVLGTSLVPLVVGQLYLVFVARRTSEG